MVRKNIYAIKEHSKAKEFTIVTGARQIGKTTLLKQLQNELETEGKPCVFLNLERKDQLLELNQNPENIFKYCPDIDERVIVFIDEIQYLDDPTNFLKLLYDEHVNKLKLIVTGSSAFYIDRNFKDSLAGRKKIFDMKTLDFEEFLMFKEEGSLLKDLQFIRSGKLKKSTQEAKFWTLLEEYFLYGGYPEVVLETNIQYKKERLNELKDSFLKRDILESGVNDEEKFYKLMILLADQSGSLVNVNELSNTLRIANATVDNYLYIMQKCFHVSKVKPFYSNLRKELVKMPKIYFNDLGLRNALLNYYQPLNLRIDKGAILENYAYLALSLTYKADDIKFWRTSDGHEVDFIIDTHSDHKAIEVKFSETEVRKTKYKKFISEYPQYPLTFWHWQGTELLY